MHRDSHELITSSVSNDAHQAFQQAVFGLAAHRPSTATALQATISADPNHVAAHTLKGFANLILARSELLPNAEAALADARTALIHADGGTEDERILVDSWNVQSAAHFRAPSRYWMKALPSAPLHFCRSNCPIPCDS
ncbi:hypothetical protein N7E02_05555 (plasmid) [Aliirhizobium terrae]|uniref:hypothetical protein n=1 Tax=Terrirhizobium terrae TaxID=2926709 RepID=UPI0025774008|nr:hypothetical protein [Rhizobium sp. CC-CFT758]WJH38805.1 hypothetical protein N7E02_05555 [Rhizobium sp. CC-CFT758]